MDALEPYPWSLTLVLSKLNHIKYTQLPSHTFSIARIVVDRKKHMESPHRLELFSPQTSMLTTASANLSRWSRKATFSSDPIKSYLKENGQCFDTLPFPKRIPFRIGILALIMSINISNFQAYKRLVIILGPLYLAFKPQWTHGPLEKLRTITAPQRLLLQLLPAPQALNLCHHLEAQRKGQNWWCKSGSGNVDVTTHILWLPSAFGLTVMPILGENKIGVCRPFIRS